MYLQNHFVINFEPKAVIVYKHAEHFTNQRYTLYSIMILQIRDIYYDFSYRLFVQCIQHCTVHKQCYRKRKSFILIHPGKILGSVEAHTHTLIYNMNM